jgi:hypothetical protein
MTVTGLPLGRRSRYRHQISHGRTCRYRAHVCKIWCRYLDRLRSGGAITAGGDGALLFSRLRCVVALRGGRASWRAEILHTSAGRPSARPVKISCRYLHRPRSGRPETAIGKTTGKRGTGRAIPSGNFFSRSKFRARSRSFPMTVTSLLLGRRSRYRHQISHGRRHWYRAHVCQIWCRYLDRLRSGGAITAGGDGALLFSRLRCVAALRGGRASWRAEILHTSAGRPSARPVKISCRYLHRPRSGRPETAIGKTTGKRGTGRAIPSGNLFSRSKFRARSRSFPMTVTSLLLGRRSRYRHQISHGRRYWYRAHLCEIWCRYLDRPRR